MKSLGPILLTAVVALSACGSGDDDVTVADVWSRASAPTQTSGAVYFDLTVADDDTLVGASVPASVAMAAQIHEGVMVGDPSDTSDDLSTGDMDDTDMDDTDTDGQMRMQELSEGLGLTGGQTVSFEPGSYHVMLIDLTGPLEVGDEFELTLGFADADDVTVSVEVAESAP